MNAKVKPKFENPHSAEDIVTNSPCSAPILNAKPNFSVSL